MEDDDEFGDLYTDVLTSFPPSSSTATHPPPPPQSVSSNLNRPIDLNVNNTQSSNDDDDDDEIFFGAASNSEKNNQGFDAARRIQPIVASSSGFNRNLNLEVNKSEKNNQLTLAFDSGKRNEPVAASSSGFDRDLNLEVNNQLTLGFNGGKQKEPIFAASSGFDKDLNLEADKSEGLAEIGKSLGVSDSDRFLDSGGEVKVETRGFEDPNFVDESKIDIGVDERDDKGDVLVEKDEDLVGKIENLESFDNFDIEEVNTGIGDVEHMIPGLSIPGVSDPANNRGAGADFLMRGEEGDDWDSDSEDDLQIVLNDNEHGPMIDRMGATGADDDDEDEDGEPLVILGDSDTNHQGMEEQDWGEDAAQGADGERKELGDATKANGGVVQPPKIPYSSHVYHPFHSQFKVSEIVNAGFCVFPFLFDVNLKCESVCSCCIVKVLVFNFLYINWKELNKRSEPRKVGYNIVLMSFISLMRIIVKLQ